MDVISDLLFILFEFIFLFALFMFTNNTLNIAKDL